MAMNVCKQCSEMYTRENVRFSDLCPTCYPKEERLIKKSMAELKNLVLSIPEEKLKARLNKESQQVQNFMLMRFRGEGTLAGARQGKCYVCTQSTHYKAEFSCGNCIKDMTQMIQGFLMAMDEGEPGGQAAPGKVAALLNEDGGDLLGRILAQVDSDTQEIDLQHAPSPQRVLVQQNSFKRRVAE